MNEFYRSPLHIKNIAHRLGITCDKTSQDFLAGLVNEGLELSIPPSQDSVESFYVCVQAAMDNHYKFQLSDKVSLAYDQKLNADTPWPELYAYFYQHFKPIPTNIALHVFDCQADGQLHYSSQSSADKSVREKDICLVKKNGLFYVLSGLEYFSPDKTKYFSKIKELFFEKILPFMIEKKCHDANGLALLNQIDKIKDMAILKDILGEPFFWCNQLEEIYAFSTPTEREVFLNKVRITSINSIKLYYTKIAQQEIDKIKGVIQLRNDYLRGVDPYHEREFFFDKTLLTQKLATTFNRFMSDVNAYLVKTAHVLEDPTVPEAEKKILRKGEITPTSAQWYASQHNMAVYTWEKNLDKRTLSCINSDIPAFSERCIHFLKEDNKYYVLQEKSIENQLPEENELSRRLHILNDTRDAINDFKCTVEKNNPVIPALKEIRLTHALFDERQSIFELCKDKHDITLAALCDTALSQKVAYVLEVVSTYYPSKFIHFNHMVKTILQHCVQRCYSSSKAIELLETLLSDLEFLNTLSETQRVLLLTAFEKNNIGEDRKKSLGLLQRLYLFRVADVTHEKIAEYLRNPELAQIREIIKEKIAHQPPARWKYFESRSDKWDFQQNMAYLISLQDKLLLPEYDEGRLNTAIVETADYICDTFCSTAKSIHPNCGEILFRYLRTPLVKTFPIKQPDEVNDVFFSKILSEHLDDILLSDEFFLVKLIEKFYPQKKSEIHTIISKSGVNDWYAKLLQLAQQVIIEKVIASTPHHKGLKESLTCAFDRVCETGEERIWLRSLSYLLDKSAVQISPEFIDLCMMVPDKYKLYKLLTHQRSTLWLKSILLELISQLLSYFIADNAHISRLIEQLDKNKGDTRALYVLMLHLEDATRLSEHEAVISPDLITETFHLLTEKIPSEEMLNELSRRPFFFWRSVLKGVPSYKPQSDTLTPLAVDDFQEDIASITKHRQRFAGYTHHDIKNYLKDKNPAWIKANAHEVIALISHAVKLTHHFYPNPMQYMAVIQLLRGSEHDRGLCGSVATSEGKTLIFAIFAIYNALQHKKVNIITSSALIDNDADAAKRHLLYEYMDVSVSSNCSKACQESIAQRRAAYKADVVYGDLGSFERDYLLSTYSDENILGDRTHDILLADEVDSVLLDKSDNVLYLSHEMPDLRHLKKLYVEIWHLIQEIPQHENTEEARKKIEERMLDSIRCGHLFIPASLKAFVFYRLPLWIDSAFAANALTENDKYVVDSSIATDQKNQKDKIFIVDKDTGVEQRQMIWGNGLHQFLQLKHQKKLTSESLRAIYISNYAYFNLFKGQIFGLSGTLGSAVERQLMSKVYNVDFFSVPRVNPRKFTLEKPLLVSTEEEWIAAIKAEVAIRQEKQAVLILCENISMAEKLEKILSDRYSSHVHKYWLTSQKLKFLSEVEHVPVKPGDIIISTNLGGRGMHLPIDETLENNGGLFEITSYMPSNERVEEQDLSRVARKGQPGGAKFIIKTAAKFIDDLREFRDRVEEKRLKNFEASVLPSLSLEKELSIKFNIFYGTMKNRLRENNVDKVKKEIINVQLKSLRDHWALWIDRQSQLIDSASVSAPAVLAAYNEFECRMEEQFKEPFKFVVLSHELIQLGKVYLDAGLWDQAIECFDEVIKREPHFAEIAHCWKIYALGSKQNNKVLPNADIDPVLRKTIRENLKKLKGLLDARLSEVAQLSAKGANAVEADNQLRESFSREYKIISAHLQAVHIILGTDISKESLLNVPEIAMHYDGVDKIFDKVVQHPELIKNYRVSKKFIESTLLLPADLEVHRADIIAQLREHVGDRHKRTVSEAMFKTQAIWQALLLSGVIKPRRVNISSAVCNTRQAMDNKRQEIERHVAVIMKEIQNEMLDKKISLAESEKALVKWLLTSAGPLKTLPRFTISFDSLEKYFSAGEIPPEMDDFKKRLFERFLSVDEYISRWSWGAFAVAMFGIAEIVAGVALSLCTTGVGALLGAILIAEGVGDISYAIQAGLRKSFSFKGFLIRKGISVSANLLLGTAGGLLSGALLSGAACSIIHPNLIALGQLGLEVGLRLVAATVSGVASLGVENMSTALPQEIMQRLSAQFKEAFTKKIMESSVQASLKAILKKLYQQIGINETNKFAEAILNKVEADKERGKTAGFILSQLSIELVLQLLKLGEQTDFGNNFYAFGAIQLLARFCLESIVDAVRVKQLVNIATEKLDQLVQKLEELSASRAQGMTSGVTAQEAEVASEAYITTHKNKIIEDFTHRLVQEILKPRALMNMARACAILSSTMANQIKGNNNSEDSASNDNQDAIDKPEDVDGGDEVSEAAHSENLYSIKLGKLGLFSSGHRLTHQQNHSHHHPLHPEHLHDSLHHGDIHFWHHQHSHDDLHDHHHHHHHHHSQHEQGHLHRSHFFHHTKTRLDIGAMIAKAAQSISLLIKRELEGLSEYRMACTRLKMLEIHLETQRKLFEMEKKKELANREVDAERNSYNRELMLQKTENLVMEHRAALVVYEQTLKREFLTVLEKLTKEDKENFIEDQCAIMEKINFYVPLGGKKLVELMRSICNDPHVLDYDRRCMMNEWLDKKIPKEVDDLIQLDRECIVLTKAMSKQKSLVQVGLSNNL